MGRVWYRVVEEVIRWSSYGRQRVIRGPSEGHQRGTQEPLGAPAGRAQSSTIKRNRLQSSAIRRHSAHLQAEPVVAQHDHRLFAPRALDGPPLILFNLRVDDVAIRDATDEGGNWVYSAAIKRNQAPSSAIQRHQLQSRAINCNHAPSSSVQGRTSSNP